MPLPKIVAAAVCVCVLGAQSWIASPTSRDRNGWYWPFLPYPMYAKAHARTDTLVVPQLHAAACAGAHADVTLTADSLGTPRSQYLALLSTIARVPQSEIADSAERRLSRAIEAQNPARYCGASAWVRTVRVADEKSYDLRNSMHEAAAWPVKRAALR